MQMTRKLAPRDPGLLQVQPGWSIGQPTYRRNPQDSLAAQLAGVKLHIQPIQVVNAPSLLKYYPRDGSTQGIR